MSFLEYKLMTGTVRSQLAKLPDNSIHCCVTSPPYWGLRDYSCAAEIWGGDPNCKHQWSDEIPCPTKVGTQGSTEVIKNPELVKSMKIPKGSRFCNKCNAWLGELGLEPTRDLYIKHLVEIFSELRRVLRDDGSFWLNLGDTYLKKRLQGVPWRTALALDDDGWLLRSEIIWWKRNALPEGDMTDRPSRCHEHLFLLSKSSNYFYDAEAIKEEKPFESILRERRAKSDKHKNAGLNVGGQPLQGINKPRANDPDREIEATRHKRTIWDIPIKGYKDAHFAVFPEKLPETIIKAGTSEMGCCPICEAPIQRLVEHERIATRPARDNKVDTTGSANRDPERHITLSRTIGWEPTCVHNFSDPKPCIVLDCFNGSGTSGAMSIRLNRRYIGIELVPEYIEMTRNRLLKVDSMFVNEIDEFS